ncbi:hypothetical protein D3C80_1324650 [compost metagenome]
MHHRTLLRQRHFARSGDDRDGERLGPGLIGKAAGCPDTAHDNAALQEQEDLVARLRVHQAAVDATLRAYAERVGERIRVLEVVVVGVLETVLAKGRRREQTGKAGGAVTVREPRVVGRQRGHRGRVRIDRRAIVLELEGVTDVARRRGGVAIAVGDGGRQRHQIVRQQACRGRAGLKRVERIVVHQRTVLGQRHVAGIGHHRDGERYGPGRISSAGGADPADDRAAFQEQVDLVARQGVHQAAVHATRGTHAE